MTKKIGMLMIAALMLTPSAWAVEKLTTAELAKKYAAAVPLGRIAVPEDLVGAVLRECGAVRFGMAT